MLLIVIGWILYTLVAPTWVWVLFWIGVVAKIVYAIAKTIQEHS